MTTAPQNLPAPDLPEVAPPDFLPDPTPAEIAEVSRALAPLKHQHALFVRHYVATGRQADAARKAGYARRSRTTAARLLKRPDVQEAIQTLRELATRRSLYDFDKVSDDLTSAIEFAYQQKNPMAVAKAVELKAKLHGMLSDRLDVRHQGDVIFQFPTFRKGEAAADAE